MNKHLVWLVVLCYQSLPAQVIGDFTSLSGSAQDSYLHLPSTHTFQYIIEHGDTISNGDLMDDQFDFTGYVPINGSSTEGYLSINHEKIPGGVTIMNFSFNNRFQAWISSATEPVDFTTVGGTARNCSGTVTPWGSIISSEEKISGDINGDGYNDYGWNIEIDPVTRSVIDQPGGLTGGDKLWAMGNFRHENVVIHQNRRTVYQADDVTGGYLYKFVANTAEDLSSGDLYVYTGPKFGNGQWAQINNTTQDDQNSTISQASDLGATAFNGGEDLEISPIDNQIYFAVKNENKVYRFTDDNPLIGGTVSNFETYVGDMTYTVQTSSGPDFVSWGTGNDNLTFDNAGNLWVMQDGDDNHIWFVALGHTQSNPIVKIFARSPDGSEPTGMTFTPDNRYMFLSFQHPSSNNSITSQLDAFQQPRSFDKDVAIVIALKGFLGTCQPNYTIGYPHILDHNYRASDWIQSIGLVTGGQSVKYIAGNNITLNPGFEVDDTATFLARIQACAFTFQ